MKIERVERPLYSYNFTAEERDNIMGTIEILNQILNVTPMRIDGSIVCGNGVNIERADCGKAIEILEKVFNCEGADFY